MTRKWSYYTGILTYADKCPGCKEPLVNLGGSVLKYEEPGKEPCVCCLGCLLDTLLAALPAGEEAQAEQAPPAAAVGSWQAIHTVNVSHALNGLVSRVALTHGTRNCIKLPVTANMVGKTLHMSIASGYCDVWVI